MVRKNEKLAFLLKQPSVAAQMQLIELAWGIWKNKRKRAFFVETYFESKQPGFFNSKEFEEKYSFTLFPNNLNFYAGTINALSANASASIHIASPGAWPAAVFEEKTISHKKRLWVNSWAGRNNIYHKVCFFLNVCSGIRGDCNYSRIEKGLKSLADCQAVFKRFFESFDNVFYFVEQSVMPFMLPASAELQDADFGELIKKTVELLKPLNLKEEEKQFLKAMKA